MRACRYPAFVIEMSIASHSPAEQLHSAAGRYQVAARLRLPPRRQFAGRDSRSGAQAIDEPLAERHEAAARDERLARLEAVLFLAREPLPARRLSQFAGLEDGTEARTLVRRLNQGYDETGRAFRIEELAGGYQLLSRPKFARWLRRLGHVPAETRLSAPAMETLAVVAYRQPVLRANIEAVRGVNCGEILRLLMERDLVRISGRSEELGRPYLYSTTRRFLQIFGLKSLEDLPRAAQMRAASPATASAVLAASPTTVQSVN